MNQPLIWAHRGASGYAPENTIEAFLLAVELGADGVELDVQLTKDNQVVVIHDETIDRTSNGQGYVCDYTLDELKRFNFNKTRPEFAYCEIPTLREVLETLQPTKLTINIELKTGVISYPGIEREVYKLVDEYGMEDRVIYSSFNHESVIKIKEMDSSAKCGFLYSDGIYHVAHYAAFNHIDAIHPSLNNMKCANLVDEARKENIQIHVWTVNEESDMDRMRQLGVEAVITNYPEKARKVYFGENIEDKDINKILFQIQNSKTEKKYRCGYCMVIPNQMDLGGYGWLRESIAECEQFVLGIPNAWVIARLYGDSKQYDAEKIKQFWINSGWVSDVIILENEQLSYQKAYEKVKYDFCLYGTEYGNQYQLDLQFMTANSISFESLMPEKRTVSEEGDSLSIALEDVQRRQKIILFGTGVYFDTYMKTYAKKHMPAYAIDNNEEKWNTDKTGIKILPPERLLQEKKENLLIIICSKNYQAMRDQLLQLGDFNYRTMIYKNDVSLLEEFAITSREESEYLVRSHEILIKLMEEFDRVCTKNNIHYYIICGSLIGVIRHHDIIPWDDDIDIAIPRADFNKLKRIAKKEWNNDTFKFLNYNELGNGAFLDCMPRLFYVKEKLPTKVFKKVYGKAKADVENRMFLDLYVMDNAFNNEKRHMFNMYAMKGIYNLMMGHRASVDYEEYAVRMPHDTIKKMKILQVIGRIIPLKLLIILYEAFSQIANRNNKCTHYFMPSCAITCIERKFDKRFFEEGQRLPYNRLQVCVPKDYDGLLNAMKYYNYMEYPRLSIRKPSHFFNSDIEIW